MPRHLISDAHEWINEIPTVPIYYLGRPTRRERDWQNQRGKKTLLSLTLVKIAPPRLLVQRPTNVGGRGRDNLERGNLRAPRCLWQSRGELSRAVVTRGKVSVLRGLRYVLIPGESLCLLGAPTSRIASRPLAGSVAVVQQRGGHIRSAGQHEYK